MGGTANRKCLICSQENNSESNNDVIKSLFGSDTYLKSKDDLKSQLSIFFLVKQVLGLPTTFLEELLKEHGSPSGWKIELCRPCSRLFSEAEFLWEKMRTLQKEFEKVSYEIKEVLVSSMSTKEGQRLLKSSEKLEAHRKAIMERSRSLKVPVVDTVRATFFLCLHEKTIDKDLESSGRQPAGVLQLVSKNGNGADISLDERGVPFLSLLDFEKKIKHLGTTIDSLSKRIDCGPEKFEKGRVGVRTKKNVEGRPEEDASDDDDDIMILNEDSEASAKGSSKSTLTAKSTTSRVNGHVGLGQLVIDDPEDEEPLIRIVNTSSIMEADEDEEESTPHLLEIVKHDISDMDMDTDTRSNDPLTPSNDKDDPDYEPCDGPTTTAKKDDNLPKPEERRSALKLLTIVPKRSGSVFECSQCGVEFETRGGCQSHILKDHYGEHKSFHCHICSAKYELLLQLSEHVGNRHGHVRTPYDDDFNPHTDFKGFKRPSISQDGPDSPSERKKEKRIPATKIYCCPTPQCSEQFDYKSKLNKHMKTCPPPSECEAGLKCELCDAKGIHFRALTMDILDIHYKNRHGVVLAAPEVVKLVVASSVKKATTAKKRIHSPRSVQDAKKPSTMKCPDCDLTLPSASAIVEHLKNPPNKCPSCAKHFRFDFDLKRHLEQEHADRVSFQCPYCPKAFSMQTIFEKHIDNHQKFDIHECEVCHEKMTGFATLTSHMENHSPILGV